MEISTIEALQNGDHKAFEEVFLAYFDKVKPSLDWTFEVRK